MSHWNNKDPLQQVTVSKYQFKPKEEEPKENMYWKYEKVMKSVMDKKIKRTTLKSIDASST